METNRQTEATASARVLVRGPGEDATYEYAEGEMLLVGSGASCGIVLSDADVAGMHCTLSLTAGVVRVRDWNTTTGTIVDGRRIDAETVVDGGAEIRVGSHRLSIEVVERITETGDAAIDVLDKVDSLLGDVSNELPNRVAAANEDTAERLDFDRPVATNGNEVERFDTTVDGYDLLSFDDETLELLKAEVELLQNELAERDARLAELESLADFDGNDCELNDAENSPEVEKLVERLEQLLDELERSDERMTTMADLLRAADDANEAEREERRQIEAWIGEIERRLTEREEERAVERTALQKSVTDLKGQLLRAEQQLERNVSDTSESNQRDEYLAEMRADYEALEKRLLLLKEDRDQLADRLAAADVETAEARTQAAIDEALREERLTMAAERTEFSQERAALAREKAELMRVRDQIEDERKHLETDPNNADQRIRAFRDHLREIHENEPEPAPQQGLSSRIGKLWRRLEGRPSDTD